jgi:hypothetical protein
VSEDPGDEQSGNGHEWAAQERIGERRRWFILVVHGPEEARRYVPTCTGEQPTWLCAGFMITDDQWTTPVIGRCSSSRLAR